MLRLYTAIANHDTSDPAVTIGFGGGTIDAVCLFRRAASFRPCVFGGLGGYKAESKQDNLIFDIQGPGVAFGGGAHLRLGGRATLHGSLRLERISWDTATVTCETPSGTAPVATPIDESGWA